APLGITGYDNPGNCGARIDGRFIHASGSLLRTVSDMVASLAGKCLLLSLGNPKFSLELLARPRWSMEGPLAGPLTEISRTSSRKSHSKSIPSVHVMFVQFPPVVNGSFDWCKSQ